MTEKRRIIITITTLRKNSKYKKAQKKRPLTRLDSIQQSAIRRHVLEYYERREVPTITSKITAGMRSVQ